MALLNGLSLNANTNLILPEHGLSGTAGSLRINSTTKALEVYSGGNWIPIKYLTSSISGGTLTTSGQYSYRTFTSSTTFVVSTSPMYADILLIGGGGAGGAGGPYDSSGRGGGGGGAGGFVLNSNVLLDVGTYNVTIGAGGVGNTSLSGENGKPTTIHINGTFAMMAPGGHGGIYVPSGERITYFFGGSAGGGGGSQATADLNNNIIPGMGNNGANAANAGGGGGGGAGGAGTTVAGTSNGGAGGAGRIFNGTYYAGGGAGGRNSFYSGTDGTGGSGGGGNTGANATANTGSGGGGGNPLTASGKGGDGGSGLVIIKYLT